MRRVLLLLAITASLHVVAQPTTEQQDAPLGLLNKTTVVPPSPEAASLGQYGNVPVSLYNGRTNISIPIYEIKGKEISLPISSKESKDKIGNQPRPFPSSESLVLQAADLLKPVIKDKIARSRVLL